MAPVGKEMAATLGGALGLGIGTVVFLPTVGAVTALGLLAAALAGLSGAALGGAVGRKADAPVKVGAR